jgi:hypothetical protein
MMHTLLVILALVHLVRATILTDAPVEFKLKSAAHNASTSFLYYDMGSNVPQAPGTTNQPVETPAWIMITGYGSDGRPIVVANQGPIFMYLPGDLGYSDLTRLTLVTVPDGYVANTWKSVTDIPPLAPKTSLPVVWFNWVLVPHNSTLQYATAAETPIRRGWIQGVSVSYMNFGRVNDIATTPVYEFYKGNDQSPTGRRLLPSLQSASPYRSVRRVSATSDFTTTPVDVPTAFTETGVIVNMPVVRAIDEPITSAPVTTPSPPNDANVVSASIMTMAWPIAVVMYFLTIV